MKARTGLWASLAIAASVGLAGCGGSSDNDDDGMMMTSHACDAGASEACVAARQAELDGLGDDATLAEQRAAQQALTEAQDALSAANAATARMGLVDAAACTDPTQACVDAHEALVDALAADVAALRARDDATNADEQAARDALGEAESNRDAVKMAFDDANRTPPPPPPHACEAGPSQACVNARRAELDALGDDDSKADHDAAEQALADAQQEFAELNDMNERTALEDAAKCTAATQACLTAHDNLVAALEGDIATLEGDDDATNAQQKEAQEALDAAKVNRDAVSMTLSDMRRDTAIGTAVADAETEADKLEADRSPEAIQAAKDAIMAAKDEIAKGDDADAFSGEIEAAEGAVARAEARNSIEAAIKAAKDAASGLATDSSVSAVTAAQALIETAKMMVSGNDDHLSEAEETAYNDEIRESAQVPVNVAKADNDAALEKQRMEEEEEQKRLAAAATKMGQDLYKALEGGLGNLETTTNGAVLSDNLMIDAVMNAGARNEETENPQAVTLEPKSGTVATLGGDWKGMDFAKTEGTGSSAYTSDEARVYHNQGAPERVPFSGGTNGKYNVVASGVDPLSGTDISSAGFYAGGGTAAVNLAGTSVSDMIEIPSFADEGTKRYPTGTNREAYEVAGTYDGAPGMYYCVPTSGLLCSSTINDGELEGLGGGTWYFKPNSGAMVSSPDNTYLYFGWWVSKDKDGVPTAASAFVGNVATPAIAADAGDIRFGWASSSPPTAGTATYTGAAVGKYAYRDISGGTAHGGHFTASAELKAKFGPTTTAGNGVTGTIDNFRLNDGTTDPGWSVSLNRASWGNGGGAIAASSEDDADAVGYAPANTTWSINGNAAAKSGTWSGTMYDEKPGDAPDGDGSNIPTVVTGTFYSEFSSEGRMVGAFGANHSGN